MADLIERDALVSLWKPLADRNCFTGNVIASCLNELNAQPTVDAVPVVRCGECKHLYGEPGQPNIQCGQMHENDFCSYGERRNGNK